MTSEERRREEMRAVEEAGGGESEGFELAEEELIEHASHGDLHSAGHIFEDMPAPEDGRGAEEGEADHEHESDEE